MRHATGIIQSCICLQFVFQGMKMEWDPNAQDVNTRKKIKFEEKGRYVYLCSLCCKKWPIVVVIETLCKCLGPACIDWRLVNRKGFYSVFPFPASPLRLPHPAHPHRWMETHTQWKGSLLHFSLAVGGFSRPGSDPNCLFAQCQHSGRMQSSFPGEKKM